MASLRTVLLASGAMIAFAANSVIARIALVDNSVNPYGFTALRLLAGAVALTLVASGKGGGAPAPREWWKAVPLFVYALGFSLAYVALDTGVGALLLFGAVQLSMVVVSAWRGQRYTFTEWVGVVIALGGLALLLSPRLTPQPVVPSALMILAGCAWGVYTLLGRVGGAPLRTTTTNFQSAALMSLGAVIVLFLVRGELSWSWSGVWLAVLSGAVTSGMGYVVWYAALPRLTASVASSVQLTVPLIAAAGGVLFVGERITLTLVLSGIVILGGIALTITGGRRDA